LIIIIIIIISIIQGSKKRFLKPNAVSFLRIFLKFHCAVLDAIHIK